MKNSLLALALAAATMPLTFARQATPAQTPAANPPAANSSATTNTKVKKHTKKSHVKKQKNNSSATTPTAK